MVVSLLSSKGLARVAEVGDGLADNCEVLVAQALINQFAHRVRRRPVAIGTAAPAASADFRATKDEVLVHELCRTCGRVILPAAIRVDRQWSRTRLPASPPDRTSIEGSKHPCPSARRVQRLPRAPPSSVPTISWLQAFASDPAPSRCPCEPDGGPHGLGARGSNRWKSSSRSAPAMMASVPSMRTLWCPPLTGASTTTAWPELELPGPVWPNSLHGGRGNAAHDDDRWCRPPKR
jgi:hypothetical protein